MYLITSSGGFFPIFPFFLYFSISFRISSRGRPCFFRNGGQIFIFQLGPGNAMALGDLFPHGSISRFHCFLPALQGEPPADMLPDSQRRGVPEQQLHHLFFVLPSAHTSQKDTGTALFHPHRDRIDLQAPASNSASSAKPTASAVMSSRLQDSSAISSPVSAVSPRKARMQLARSKSFLPIPYPIFDVVITGISRNSLTKCFKRAAPVGVQSSPCTWVLYAGIPCKIWAVAGAGTGRIPWAQ